MTRKKTLDVAVVTAQAVANVVDEDGKVVSSIPISPKRVVDLLAVETSPSEGIAQVTSLTTGASLTMGYTPQYAEGYEHVFGSGGRTSRDQRN